MAGRSFLLVPVLKFVGDGLSQSGVWLARVELDSLGKPMEAEWAT